MMHDATEGPNMRTTLTIDDDILAAAKGLAAHRGQTVGEVISNLAREALRPTHTETRSRTGILLLPVQAGATQATLEIVNQLRDDLPAHRERRAANSRQSSLS